MSWESYAPAALAITALASSCCEELKPTSGPRLVSSSMRCASVAGVAVLLLTTTKNGRQPVGTSEEPVQSASVSDAWPRWRVLLGTAFLVGAAFAGTRDGLLPVRTSDALLTFLLLLFLLVQFAMDHHSPSSLPSTHLPTLWRFTYAVLVAVGARLFRDGLLMCAEVERQGELADYGLEPEELTSTPLCVACSAMGAAATAVSGGAALLVGVVSLWFHYTDSATLASVSASRMAVASVSLGVHGCALVVAFLALGDVAARTCYVYEDNSCTIGGGAENAAANSTSQSCPVQLVEFRRLGLVQLDLATNTFAFLASAAQSLLVEQLLRLDSTQETLESQDGGIVAPGIVRPGLGFAGVASAVAVLLRSLLAGWRTDWVIEIVFAVVFVGASVNSIGGNSTVAGAIIYLALFVEYAVGCVENGECPSLQYLTNVSNAIMGCLFLIVVGIEIADHLFKPEGGFFRTALEPLLLVGLSIALLLAVLVTSALAVYDGSDLTDIIGTVSVGRQFGMLQNHSVLRFVLWHYAPLAAWASFYRSYCDATRAEAASTRVHFKLTLPFRVLFWFGAAVVDGVVWQIFLTVSSNYSEAPAAYPMSQIFLLALLTLPPWAFSLLL